LTIGPCATSSAPSVSSLSSSNTFRIRPAFLFWKLEFREEAEAAFIVAVREGAGGPAVEDNEDVEEKSMFSFALRLSQDEATLAPAILDAPAAFLVFRFKARAPLGL
jgi:hypothetical protein